MKTYSAYVKGSGTPLFQGVAANELFLKLPAGSKLIGGTPLIDKETGALLAHRATFRHGGREITISEDQEKKQ